MVTRVETDVLDIGCGETVAPFERHGIRDGTEVLVLVAVIERIV